MGSLVFVTERIAEVGGVTSYRLSSLLVQLSVRLVVEMIPSCAIALGGRYEYGDDV